MNDDPFGALLSQTPPPQTPAAGTPPPVAQAPAQPPTDDPFGAALTASQQPPAPEQVPDWSQIPGQALSNLGPSAGAFAHNLAQPIMHPIQTAENLGNVGLGYMEKAGRNLGLPSGQGYEQYADAVNQMVMDRYGSIDNFKKTLAHDPVGAAADLSAVISGTGLTRLPGVAGKIASTVNTIADPLTLPAAVAKGAAKTAGYLGKEALGFQTGIGPEAIGEAARTGAEGGEAGRVFRENMRGEAPMEQVVAEARGALQNLREQRGTEYRRGMSGVAANQTVPVGAWNQIGRAIQDAAGIKTFKGQDLSPKTAAIREELNNTVLDWMALPSHDFHTAEGLDALKQKIGDIRDSVPYGSPEKLIANKYYGAIRQSIIDHVPEYAKVMKGYEEASDQVREIERALSLPQNERRASVDTSLRKLQSVLRNNVSSNYGHRSQLVDYLQNAGAPNIKAALAGQSASTLTPRSGVSRILAGGEGISAITAALLAHPLVAAAAIPVLLASSPRIVGEAVHGAARLSPYAGNVINKPVARALQQVGRVNDKENAISIRPLTEARGGAIERALRATKRK
jgi:hypothetical protein